MLMEVCPFNYLITDLYPAFGTTTFLLTLCLPVIICTWVSGFALKQSSTMIATGTMLMSRATQRSTSG